MKQEIPLSTLEDAVIADPRPEGGPGRIGIAGALVRGTLWSVTLRWGNRLMGLMSTLVVARILLPADYGLVAMAGLVMGFVQTFLDADASTALLRSADPDKDLQDSAWTLTVIQSVIVAAVVSIAAPFAARYFDEPRLTTLIYCNAAFLCFTALQSVGPLLARKTFDFSLEVKIAFIGKLTGLIATICLAYLWRSYWALIVGAMVGSTVYVIAGYALHPYRPRFTLVKAGTLWHFSQWMLISGIGTFFALKADGFIVGRVGAARDLGLYNVAMEIGLMVTIELGAPLNRALLPVLSTLHAEPARLRGALMQTVAAVNTFTMPAGIGLALVAPLVLAVVLGPNWLEAAPLLAVFAFMGAFRFVVGPYYTLFLTLGKSRILAMMSWAELVIFVGVALALWRHGVYGIAAARLIACVVYVFVWVVVGQANGLAIRALGRAILRPFIGCALMTIVLVAVPRWSATPLVELAIRMALGAATYCAVMTTVWLLMGRPHGIETRIYDHLRSLHARRQAARG